MSAPSLISVTPSHSIGQAPENLTEHAGSSSEASELRGLEIAIEALSHEKESLRLRTLLNAHAPINQLPPEILSLIFLHYAAAFQEQQFANFYVGAHRDEEAAAHKRIYTWLSVAQVCRGWREVALQCASLWGCLVIDERVPEDVLRTFLERSQGVPLTVIAHAVHHSYHCDACVDDVEAEGNLEAGFDVLGRITERVTQLKLYLCEVQYAAVWDRLAGSGRNLTSLHIEAVGQASYESRSINLTMPSVLVPNVLFEEHRPPLRSLSFFGVGLAWSNALFSSTLRRLDIAKCLVVGWVGIAADVGDLLQALRSMPNLEAFAIDSVSLPDSDPRTEYQPVDLPQLRHVCVPIHHRNSMTLLLHLRLPHNASIQFASEAAPPQTRMIATDVLAGYTAGLARLLDGMQAYAISHYSGYSHEYCKLWAKVPRPRDPAAPPDGSTAHEDEPAWKAIAATPPRLRFDCDLANGVVQAVLLGLDVQHLRVLAVAPRSIGDRTWADVFAPATHITSLRVQEPGAFALGAVLARWKRPAHMNPHGHRRDHNGFGALPDRDDDPRAEDGYAPGPLLFPCLRTICIIAVDFPLERKVHGRGYRHSARFILESDDSDPEGVPYGFEVASLLKCLRVRAKMGAAEVVRLEFERSQCWERERLAPLVRAVREVWWDGKRLSPGNLGEQRRRDTLKRRPIRLSESDPSDSAYSD